jgi:hypothetical protein
MAETDYKRGIVSYTSRDYESLVEEFWKMVPRLTELWQPGVDDNIWRPEANADPGVVLGKYLASVADMLGVNLDWMANEVFAPSVSQRKDAEKVFGLIGYELGFYTAARTEVEFKNNSTVDLKIDFGFNGSNFCTLNAYTDITKQPRVITYNILPLTNTYGATETRSKRSVLTENLDVFAESDIVTLKPGQSVTRVAIEGELRYVNVSVESIKRSNYIVTLPSQHIDTTAIWVKARSSQTADSFLQTQWIQCSSPAEFIQPEPRFAVTYDSYSNAQLQISNYLNQLENYDKNWLTIYWIDCSGVIGCVGQNVLQDLLLAKPDQSIDSNSGDLLVSNLPNTVELPHTNIVVGKSPETAKEAYFNSRNYINTWDSLITLPDFNRFLNREPGVDCGVVIDCQKALEYNLAVYNDENLTDSQKSKMYITKYDFPEGDPIFDWSKVLNLGFDPSDPNKFVFSTNFKRYTAMCFAIHNDFKPSTYGRGQSDKAQIRKQINFVRYKPPTQFITNVERDYKPLQAMTVDLEFGWARIFPFYCVGTITPTKPVSKDVAETIISKAKEALALYFSPANRKFGVKPTLMEVIDVIEKSDSRIRHFDPGSAKTEGIVWADCDIDYFNLISFAKYDDSKASAMNIRINPTYITNS